MRIIDIALKDLLQIVRDWKSALFLAIMPIMFTLFFGFVLKEQEPQATRIPVALVDQSDGGVLANRLWANLDEAGSLDVQSIDPGSMEMLEEMLGEGEFIAAVIVPDNFDDGLELDPLPEVILKVDQMTPAGQTVSDTVRTAIQSLRSSLKMVALSVQAYEGQQAFPDQASRDNFILDLLPRVEQARGRTSLELEVQQAIRAEDPSAKVPMGFAQSSPGMMVQFAIFGLITCSMVLLLERQSGALQRLMTTPVRKSQIIGGHVLAMFSVIFLQELLLALVGQLAFGVAYSRAPLAVLIVLVALAFWAASVGLLIGAISRKQEQVILIAMIAMFLLSGLGGAWFPLEVTGETFATIGHLLPSAWAMDGLQNIIVRGQGLGSVLTPAAVLLGYGGIFYALAVWRFRYA